MKTVKDAVDHYFPKRMKGEMSIADIRSEIIERHDFREEHVKEICREISELEFAALNADKKPALSFQNKLGFSYLMLFSSLVIIVLCVVKISRISKVDSAELGKYDKFTPYVFIAGALFLIGKHLMRIKKSKENEL
jgi:hypothetical protein